MNAKPVRRSEGKRSHQRLQQNLVLYRQSRGQHAASKLCGAAIQLQQRVGIPSGTDSALTLGDPWAVSQGQLRQGSICK